MAGNTARGASSPAKPALHVPDPLSMTTAGMSPSDMITSYTVINIIANE